MKRDSGPRERIGSALVVEDDPAMSSALADAVTDAGYVPVVVRSVDEALAAMREERPDLVLLDLGLEEKFGAELLETLSRDAHPLRVVIVSGFPLADLVAARFGAELVKKPFALETLLEAIERAGARDSQSSRTG